jgi:hypothetical protein
MLPSRRMLWGLPYHLQGAEPHTDQHTAEKRMVLAWLDVDMGSTAVQEPLTQVASVQGPTAGQVVVTLA